ncbi:MAG: DNA-processing protein DprA [Spirochaetes bacterium]|nr:DNA-processing protein DprA [Spirochaetota bacterium]
MNKQNLKYFIALNYFQKSPKKDLISLVRKGNVERLFQDKKSQSKSVSASQKKLMTGLVKNAGRLLGYAEKEIEWLKKEGQIKIITFFDKEYPSLLKNIYDPPFLLYARGDISILKEPSLSIVGSRLCTSYGSRVAYLLARDLVSLRLTVVSGMAIGIDKFAHKGALESGGKTIAVLGSGLGHIYPPENRDLFREMVKKGLVLSEFPLAERPLKQNFPMRNRIISGLSMGTVVVEARARSGALITAHMACEQGREVFAIPGPVNAETSKGTNKLIKEGAKLVQSVSDIISELNIPGVKAQKKISNKKSEPEEHDQALSQDEKMILKFIDYEPKKVEEIIEKSKLKVNIVERTLMMLEIKGFIKQIPGYRFHLV